MSRFVTVVALSLGAYVLMIRPRMLRWEATDEEVDGPFPGAEVVPDGKRGATMATTIDAPPSQLWSWLVQMGCDRAGWYSWDRLDNSGVASAERIHPEWQEISIGDRMDSLQDGSAWFEVAVLEPDCFLGLRATLDLRGRPVETVTSAPRFYTDSLWGFLLEELPDNRTRLVISGYASARPRLVGAIGNLLFWEPAHWIMQTRQFANLKRRVERQTVDRDYRANRPARAAYPIAHGRV